MVRDGGRLSLETRGWRGGCAGGAGAAPRPRCWSSGRDSVLSPPRPRFDSRSGKLFFATAHPLLAKAGFLPPEARRFPSSVSGARLSPKPEGLARSRSAAARASAGPSSQGQAAPSEGSPGRARRCRTACRSPRPLTRRLPLARPPGLSRCEPFGPAVPIVGGSGPRGAVCARQGGVGAASGELVRRCRPQGDGEAAAHPAPRCGRRWRHRGTVESWPHRVQLASRALSILP